MANNLNFGGGEVILIRDKGVAAPVQGFITNEITQGRNDVALPTNYLFQLIEFIQFPISTIVDNKFWIKISGDWKEAITWIKVSGIWKQASPKVKIEGEWK